MKVELTPVAEEEKEILRNLLEKYLYEFSQWDACDVNALGLYGYSHLDNYWTEAGRWPNFMKVDGTLAGFAMVFDFPEMAEETDYSMAEFFVMHKYRRKGVGKAAAFQLFRLFPGRWQLKRHPKNPASVAFWDQVVSEYTNGAFSLITSCPGTEYPDGTPGDVFCFNT